MARFGKYELLSELAKGGMGETYLAELQGAAGVTKRVVIKKMLPTLALDAGLVEAFVQEAQISATLSHGNIAQVFDFGEIDGTYYLAMEYVRGRSLLEVIKRAPFAGYPRLPFAVSAYVAIEVLKALHYAHTRVGADRQPLGLVHRDVTPDNVLIGFDGEVKLVDFGVAKAQLAGRTETEPGVVKGKYRYLSPEQVQSLPVDARTDVFTLGIVLYELLTGTSLFSGKSHRLVEEIVSGAAPEFAADVPEALREAASKALARAPEQRFSTALDMQVALTRWLFSAQPDVTGEVLRELMGELFAGELESEGSPFEAKPGPTRVLRALKSESSLRPLSISRPALGGLDGPVPELPDEPATTVPLAPAPPPSRWGLIAGVVALLVVGGGSLVVLLMPAQRTEQECVREGERVLATRGAEAARAATMECLGTRVPTANAARALDGFTLCGPQLERLAEARRALASKDTARAETLGAFTPVDCAAAQHRELWAQLAAGGSSHGPPNPTDKRAEAEKLLMLARADLEAKQYDVARVRLQKCLALDDQNAHCHRLLGAVLGHLKEEKAGEDELQKFLKLAPGDPQAAEIRKMLEHAADSMMR